MNKKTQPARPASDCYTMCKHCNHFVEDNTIIIDDYAKISPVKERHELFVEFKDGTKMAKYIHLENGEQAFDHDANPGNLTLSLEGWKKEKPLLFKKYKDGEVGANSMHSPLYLEGKIKRESWKCTDPDTNQYGREIKINEVFEFQQDEHDGINPLGSHREDTIILAEYSLDDIEAAINSYGYTLHPVSKEGTNNVFTQYGKDANWIIAECLFELDM